MPRAAQDKAYKVFSNGYVTEATGLTYPENSLRDVDNCDIELRGLVRRRLGLTQEPGGIAVGTGSLDVQTYANNTGGPLSAGGAVAAATVIETYTTTYTPAWTLTASGGGRAQQDVDGVRLGATQGQFGSLSRDVSLSGYDLFSVEVKARETTSNEGPLAVMAGTTSAGLGQGYALSDGGLYEISKSGTRDNSGISVGVLLNNLNYETGGPYRVKFTYSLVSAGIWAVTIQTIRNINGEIVDTRSSVRSFSGNYIEFCASSGQSHQSTWLIDYVQLNLNVTESAGDTGQTTVLATDLAISQHVWPNPAGLDGRNWVVFQIGNQLFFRDHRRETVSIEGGTIPSGSESLPFDGAGTGFVYAVTAAQSAQVKLQSAVGNGRIWFTSTAVIPFYAEYDQEADSIVLRPNGYQAAGDRTEAATGSRRIRDFNGVPDALANDDQPGALTQAHLYNLLNQGWPEANIQAYFTSQTRYPSNSQQWTLGKDTSDDFDPALLAKQDFGNGLAPRGRRVLDALVGTKDGITHTLAGVTSPLDFDESNDERSLTGWTAVGFFAGRVWYAGDSNRRRPNGIYFSNTLSTPRDSGSFLQQNDPTAEDFSDLLDTDGGVIYIPEADKILKLQPYGVGILVMATNGIWLIYGGQSGFTATSYSVEKVSSTGVLSPETVISTEQSVVFWASNGIHVLALPESGTIPVVNDVSATKIFSYYAQIPLAARLAATGTFDSVVKKVVWFWLSFSETEPGNLFDRALTYDTRTGAFTKYSFRVDLPGQYGIAGAFPRLTPTTAISEQVLTLSTGEPVTTIAGEIYTILAPSTQMIQEPVTTVAGVSITTIGGEALTVPGVQSLAQPTQNSLKFLVLDGTDKGIRLGELNNRSFFDFLGFGNATNVARFFQSYVITGDETLGDLQRNKQATYIHSFFNKTESGFVDGGAGVPVAQDPSSCRVVGRWDWHSSSLGGRWSDSQQAYRYRKPYAPGGFTDPYDTGESIVYTKLKVRGHGRALTLRYDSDDGKDFQLLGFSAALTATGV